MSASCPKVSFTLSSVSRKRGRLCVPWLKTETGVTTIAPAIKGFDLHQGGTGSVPSVICGRDGARPSQ